MSPTVAKLRILARRVVLATLLLVSSALSVGAEKIPRPEGIQADVNFWIRVYSEVTTNEGFLHDERNLAVIYESLRFSASSSPRDRQRVVDDHRDRYVASLRRIAAALSSGAGREALSDEDKHVL